LTTDVTHIEWRSDDEDNILFHHEGSVEILSDLDDKVEEIPDEYYEMMNHINLNYPEDEGVDI
tara:strand:+ start:596 stop:784 length:189 start_codon:yes stop_codon:yes gene_type:complete